MNSVTHVTYLLLLVGLLLVNLGLAYENDNLRANTLQVPGIAVSELMKGAK
jgi:hypothetical protein